MIPSNKMEKAVFVVWGFFVVLVIAISLIRRIEDPAVKFVAIWAVGGLVLSALLALAITYFKLRGRRTRGSSSSVQPAILPQPTAGSPPGTQSNLPGPSEGGNDATRQ